MACLDTISTTEFKSQFSRDFLYLPVWVVTQTYNTGDEVYYEPNGLFYRCLQNGVVGGDPSAEPLNWEQYSDNVNDYVLDADIEKAFLEAKLSFNEGLGFTSCDQTKFVFYYLTAHYLLSDLKASTQDGAVNRVVSSRSVGSVSESYEVPDVYKQDPLFTMLSTTYYGAKYIALVAPKARGNIVVVQGGATPW